MQAYMYLHGRGCAKSETNAEYFLKLADQLDSQQPVA
jgi:TPR repeat protein